MKGVNLFRMRWRHLSLTLIALIFTSIFLWAWEKNPLVTTLLSAQDQFLMPPTEVLVDVPIDDSVSKTPAKNIEENSQPISTDHDDALTSTDHDDSPTSKNHAEHNEKEHSHSASEDRSVEEAVESFIADSINSTEKKVCNYGKGRWVADNRRPLYSGFGCKQWLSEMWACRMTQRKDFSYEGYRLQPENCEMPEFEASAFLKRMQDKTLAFIGDSLGRQQFQSLMCMATSGEYNTEVEDIGSEYGLVKPRGAIRPDGWAYRFPTTNTTILYYWSASLCDLEPLNVTDPATEVAMHLDRPPSFLSRNLHRFHVVVLNTGHHWNRGKLRGNRWVMYIDGKPNKDRKLAEIGNAKNFAINSISKWLDSQLPSHPNLIAFFRTISPRHFANGDWNTGGSCDNTMPLARGSEVSKDDSSDPIVENAVKGTKVKLLDITAISQLRDEGHISRYSAKATEGAQDCLHWCLPGIPDTWNELIYAQL